MPTGEASKHSGQPQYMQNKKYLLMSLFRNLASTHFEPTSARMAFPCFDEPSFKANFSVRIRRSPEHISLSNMPVVSVMLVTAHVQMCVKKATMTLSCISGENG